MIDVLFDQSFTGMSFSSPMKSFVTWVRLSSNKDFFFLLLSHREKTVTRPRKTTHITAVF